MNDEKMLKIMWQFALQIGTLQSLVVNEVEDSDLKDMLKNDIENMDVVRAELIEAIHEEQRMESPELDLEEIEEYLEGTDG